MKLCKDCKHCIGGEYCHAPKNIRIDPVTGMKRVRGWTFCNTHRNGAGVGLLSRYLLGTCGKTPRWFEPKD